MVTNNFQAIIQKDRQERKHKLWEGTLLDYLEIIREKPQLAMLAHERMYGLLAEPGVEIIKTEDHPRLRRIYGNDTIKRYKFFEFDFFGIDKVIMDIIRYFHSATMRGEESRQVLYLVGPVGSGKSSIMEALKRALESSNPIFGLKGCPMREEPLHLIPKHLRRQFEELLGVRIEGDLCPVCRYRLIHEYGGEYERFPVQTVDFSIRGRQGIAVVPPVDPNNQDASVLVGSVDISKMDLYPEDDPRVLSLNGAFNAGNRGLVEFIEIFKNDVEYLHTIITATQEKSIPSPGKGPMIYFDGIILAHSNEAEWNKFKSDHTNEAILDRIVKIEVPYCLELDQEVKIYQKILKKSNFKAHIAPHTIEIASMFAIMSRLSPSNKVDSLTKMRIYNGEEIVEKDSTKKVDIQELRDESYKEGLSGVSTRFIMKAIDNALSEAHSDCINPILVMESLIKAVRSTDMSDEEKKKLLGLIQETLKMEYNRILEKEVTRAFIHGYQEQAETLFNNYLDHAEAYVNKTRLKDKNTGEELEPDEKFLESIETQLGITGTAAKGFRSDVTAYMFALLRNRSKIDFKSYEPLKEAIEKKLIASVRELSRVVTQARVRDPEQSQKYDAMVEAMKNNGYCDHCCNVILKYAANNLWKD
ncbi:Serine-protein kinase, PrkA [Syntrophomonas zehnderi OL-4]|uniref:Serine-protein kinase, PrkA n=1 Tax=Syntrophomonas zehnderi OL-4 TaxID=690567 RepID=A0A0E3W3I6_9FIRM|nr:PrkA family serine protein kinase [Syntrophomonas zehnderi]CFX85150.1 Serine-protein kinase, PrkA [Syntrophomonas zehnderi OL-4]